MAYFVEANDSRAATVGGSGDSIDFLFQIHDTEDDTEAKAVAEANLPAFYQSRQIDDYRIEHVGGGVWEGEARYSFHVPQLEIGEHSIAFDTTGGTQHLTQSIETVGKYSRAGQGEPPDFKGAIGVTGDSVEGVDIPVPVLNWTETHVFPMSQFTMAYVQIVSELTGKTNNAPFRGFPKDEVRFEGGSGQQRDNESAQITVRFSRSPNKNDIQVGDITVLSKRGWEYLWIRYAASTDQNVLVQVPEFAYVERVHESGDFGQLGIGS